MEQGRATLFILRFKFEGSLLLNFPFYFSTFLGSEDFSLPESVGTCFPVAVIVVFYGARSPKTRRRVGPVSKWAHRCRPFQVSLVLTPVLLGGLGKKSGIVSHP